MTNSTLNGNRIAMLVANGFEEVHFTETQRRFAGTGAEVTVISPENGLVNGWHEGSWGHYFPIDK
ncbi:MAG: peptidase C56, partial [Pseudomonadota bacterium]